jgi:type I restriction enzyme S subunit
LSISACFPDSVVGVVADPTTADTIFLKYAIDGLRPQLRRITKGATQDNLSVAKLLAFKFPAPPVTTQRRIGEIIRNYGDLIDNNRRRMLLLKEASRLLYQEWFVRLRFPGHEHTRITNGVPDGWERVALSEHVNFERGIEPGTSNYHSKRENGFVRFLRVGDLGGRPCNTFIDPAVAKGLVLTPPDIVISLDGTVGLVRIGLEGAFSSGIRRVVPRAKGSIGWAYLYELLQSENIQNTIQAHAKGTTIKHAGSAVDAMRFVRPPDSLTRYFEDQAAPLLRQQLTLLKVNEYLASARDLLLPRLMSGAIPV